MEGSSPGSYPSQKYRSRQDREFIAPDRQPSLAGSVTASADNHQNAEGPQIQRIEIEIFGQKYIVSGAGDCEKIKAIGRFLDREMHEIAQQSRGVSVLKIAILAALNICERMIVQQEETIQLKEKIESLISLLSEVIDK